MKTALILLAALTAASTAQAPVQPQLEVHFIDVGQGDAMLIRSPAGKTVLIDAGNTGAGGAVNDYLDSLGVTTLDLAVITHPHLDHMGGMLQVLEKHPPKRFLDPEYDHPIENYKELLRWLGQNGVPIELGRAERIITIEPGITLELFSPEEPLLEGTRSDANSNSVVIRLVYGTQSFLFTGDSEEETEQRVMNRAGEKLESTVLKVAHHGGRHSTSEGWLARVNPRYAVISCGSYNRYGHPTKDVLDRLGARRVEVYRTDRQGDVIARTDGKSIRWETTGDRSARLDEKGGVSSFARGQRDEHAHRPKPVLVDLNTAALDALAALPGTGPGLAQRLIDDRTERGPFADLDALLRVKGITRAWIDGLQGRAFASHVAAVEQQPQVATAQVPAGSTGKAPTPTVRPGAFRTRPGAAQAPATTTADTSGRLLQGRTRVNINIVDAAALARATSLAPEVTRKVIDYREEEGFFLSFDDLEKIGGLSREDREKLAEQIAFRLNLNTATQAQLEALKIEASEAQAVVEYRQKTGDFGSIDELEEIEQLAPRTRLRVAPLLTAK